MSMAEAAKNLDQTISDLFAVVEDKLVLSRPARHQSRNDLFVAALRKEVANLRRSSVDGRQPWRILIAARTHLCVHVMEAGDVQAWNLMADIQAELLAQRSATCVATVCQGSWDANGYECGKPSVGSTEMCCEHLAESFHG